MITIFSYFTVTHCSIILDIDSYKEDKAVSILSAISAIGAFILLIISIFYPEILPLLVEQMKNSFKNPVML